MASIFTYEFETPRVESPWLAGQQQGASGAQHGRPSSFKSSSVESVFNDWNLLLNDDINVTRLEAEPQEGPTEYKLHLLLRPRRPLLSSSTGHYITGSRHSKAAAKPRADHDLDIASPASPPVTSASSQFAYSNNSRQHRLEQLTTQLLWRLQQSSPIHAASVSSLVLPELPDATLELQQPQRRAKLLPGLEESKGALYEIGVSDDGALIGLAQDEMTESLNNLRAMAASLGCSVDVIRMVPVGECQWFEEASSTMRTAQPRTFRGTLWVAEAYIKPELGDTILGHDAGATPSSGLGTDSGAATAQLGDHNGVTEQLRISLTGTTNSGKSSLLGTLSTSALDNGRGKSRLTLLKHRHEIVSGMTSSVSQELIGYLDVASPPASSELALVNYATSNISSWNNIHASISSGRLVLLSDSAGHPRYRRTTVRGLVSCAPHWTFVCISASESTLNLGSNAKVEGTDSGPSGSIISLAHLDLCLRLDLALVIVVTKLDLASKTSFRQILSSILSRLKAAGRRPITMSTDNVRRLEADVQHISMDDLAEAIRITGEMAENAHKIVPVIFTSAVKGTGIGKVHALLRYLPFPVASSPNPLVIPQLSLDTQKPSKIFHIDDMFNLPTGQSAQVEIRPGQTTLHPRIVSGLLVSGRVQVGEILQLGPFSDASSAESSERELSPSKHLTDQFLSPRSFTDALAKATNLKPSTNESGQEWISVRVVTIRNLRLPVKYLEQDRVGTIAISPVSSSAARKLFALRKGMILTSGDSEPTAYSTFTAVFEIEDAGSFVVGSRVVLYTASVRASAKVIAIALETSPAAAETQVEDATRGIDELTFRFDEEDDVAIETNENNAAEGTINVTFRLATYKEWIEPGAKVLIMPGGGPGLQWSSERGVKGVGGLEGFVGTVTEVFQ